MRNIKVITVLQINLVVIFMTFIGNIFLISILIYCIVMYIFQKELQKKIDNNIKIIF